MVNYFSGENAPDWIDDRRRPKSIFQQLARRDTINHLEWIEAGGKGWKPPPGKDVFLARATHSGSWTPGYYDVAKKTCLIAWGGQAHKKEKFQILCSDGDFLPCTDTNTLLRGTPIGVSEEGEPLYIGRVKKDKKYIHGKVQRSHGVCYVPIKGKEKAFKDYEIFVASATKPEAATPRAAAAPKRMGTAQYVGSEYKHLQALIREDARRTARWRVAMGDALNHENYQSRSAFWLPRDDHDEFPPDAVTAGPVHGRMAYVGRAMHEGSLTPGFIVPEDRVCHIVWGGDEYSKADYEVLVDPVGFFQPTQDDMIPRDALPAGQSEQGEVLFIGQVYYRGNALVGKVQASHGGCYVPIGAREELFTSYNIFISA